MRSIIDDFIHAAWKPLKRDQEYCLRSFKAPGSLEARVLVGWKGSSCILPLSKGLRKEQGLLAQLTLNRGLLPRSPITHLSEDKRIFSNYTIKLI